MFCASRVRFRSSGPENGEEHAGEEVDEAPRELRHDAAVHDHGENLARGGATRSPLLDYFEHFAGGAIASQPLLSAVHFNDLDRDADGLGKDAITTPGLYLRYKILRGTLRPESFCGLRTPCHADTNHALLPGRTQGTRHVVAKSPTATEPAPEQATLSTAASPCAASAAA